MYLLTFVTLIIGVIGLYSQVLAVQTARIAAGQSGVGAAMVAWHAAAMSMAASITRGNSTYYTAYPNGCSLTYSSAATNCPAPVPVSPQPAPPVLPTSGTVTDNSSPKPVPSLFIDNNGKTECVPIVGLCSATDGAGNCTKCAAQYDTVNYQFNSVLYHAATPGGGSTADYVVTYVPPATISAANPAPGFITLAKGNMLGFTLSELAQQLNHTILPAYAYGTVQNGKLGSAATLPSSGAYNVPTTITNGSLAIVAAPDGL